MAGGASADGRGLAFLAEPRVTLRLGAAAMAAVLLALGFLALSELPEPGAVSASDAAQAMDGPIVVEGEIGRVFSTGAPPVTSVHLRGADALEVRIAGDLTRAYAPGDFVALHAVKRGSTIEASSIRHAVDPMRAAAPYLATGAVLASLVGLDAVVPRIPPRLFPPVRALFARLRPRWPRPKTEEEAAASGADNHSGAPAPKG